MIFCGWHVTRIANICQYMTTTFFLVTFIFINTIVYIALKKPELFAKKNKYNQSALSESKKQLIINHLQKIMRQKKPHLQPTISLPELAQLLSISKHHLSQVINESYNLNFNDFINMYRIDEAMTLLQDKTNCNKTILEIAYIVGFNSKSTFNSAFKKHTGQTPKEFKNNGKVQPHFSI
jgi:AraC-like DNA-binding protein